MYFSFDWVVPKALRKKKQESASAGLAVPVASASAEELGERADSDVIVEGDTFPSTQVDQPVEPSGEMKPTGDGETAADSPKETVDSLLVNSSRWTGSQPSPKFPIDLDPTPVKSEADPW